MFGDLYKKLCQAYRIQSGSSRQLSCGKAIVRIAFHAKNLFHHSGNEPIKPFTLKKKIFFLNLYFKISCAHLFCPVQNSQSECLNL